MLDIIHKNMLQMALEHRQARTYTAHNFDEFQDGIAKGGFVKAMWCGDTDCELAIKEKTGATTRCMPFHEQEHLGDVCVHCGKPAKKMMYVAKSY